MSESLIKVQKLRKWFPVRLGFARALISSTQPFVKAVDGVSFEIKRGEIFGLAGESGSGKTTTGRLLVKLIQPSGGRIFFEGKDITFMGESEFKPLRRKLQIIFQDPYESLNPRMLIRNIVEEPLVIQGAVENLEERLHKVMEDVQLTPPEEFLARFPHELSGGQRQRVAVARALVLNPEFIVADEPVSMLDVSIRAEVLNLLVDLRDKYNVGFLFITHDLALSRHICDRLAVMYLGKIVEMGTVDKIVGDPLHPYTKALIRAVPVPDPTSRRAEAVLSGEIPSAIFPPSGCRFHTRCPEFLGEVCKTKEPQLVGIEKERFVACHIYGKK